MTQTTPNPNPMFFAKGKDRLSDPWTLGEFLTRAEAEQWCAERAWVSGPVDGADEPGTVVLYEGKPREVCDPETDSWTSWAFKQANLHEPSVYLVGSEGETVFAPISELSVCP